MTKYMKSKRNHNNNRWKTKNQLHRNVNKHITTNSVVNLSNQQLTESSISALSKGLRFIPTPKPTPYVTVYNSFLSYRRQMYLKHHFRQKPHTKHPFKLASQFSPPQPDNSNLTEYISRVLYDIKTKHTNTKTIPNLSHAEIESINRLKDDDDIIIKQADKGGAIVIWPREDYLTEAYQQLNNVNHYKRINYNPTTQLRNTIRTLVNKMYANQLIDYTTYKFLMPNNNPRMPTLYLLPKIHKPCIPGRPIISGCGGPTVSLSQYADHILKPLLTSIPSYIQDTTAFLKHIFSLNDKLPPRSDTDNNRCKEFIH